MKQLCYQCKKSYHKDYILFTGPYWCKEYSSPNHLCVYCFEKYYTRKYIPKITKSPQYITKYC